MLAWSSGERVESRGSMTWVDFGSAGWKGRVSMNQRAMGTIYTLRGVDMMAGEI